MYSVITRVHLFIDFKLHTSYNLLFFTGSILFIPRLPADYAIWMGRIPSLDEYKTKYEVDECHYVDEITKILQDQNPEALLVLNGVNSDSGKSARTAVFEGMSKFKVDNSSLLFNQIAECRVFKTDREIEVLRYVCDVSSRAHIEG